MAIRNGIIWLDTVKTVNVVKNFPVEDMELKKIVETITKNIVNPRNLVLSGRSHLVREVKDSTAWLNDVLVSYHDSLIIDSYLEIYIGVDDVPIFIRNLQGAEKNDIDNRKI